MNEYPIPCTVVKPSDMKLMEAFADRVTFLLTGAETGGKYCAFLVETAPGGGPPPHVHAREDEWFHVIEGEAEFFAGGQWSKVEAGASVFAPKGSLHAFRNAGDTVLRQLIHTSPAGFEDFFQAITTEWQRPGGPDMGRIVAISEEYGITYPGMDEVNA